MDTDARLETIERDLAALAQRVALLERPAPATPPQPAVWGAPALVRERAAFDWEALVGGRLLALVGGGAVVIGVGLLVALAAERGWLDERARVGLALAGSLALVAGGVWLHERRGRTQASLALAGAGFASLYATLTAAAALYRLVPAAPALTVALLVGAGATALAVRWDATALAGIGMLGALASPALVDAPATPWTLGFLLVAHAAALAVLVWRAWDWLAVGAFAIVMVQVAWWVVVREPSAGRLVLVLALFGALNLAAALRRPSVVLGVANAVVLTGLGLGGLAEGGGRWVAALAAVHGVLGLLLFARRDAARLLLVLAVLLADVAFPLLADGPVLPVGWAASALLLAEVGRRWPEQSDLAGRVLPLQLVLAVTHVLLYEARPAALLDGVGDLTAAALALGAIALAAWRAGTLAVAGAAAVYLASVAIVTAVGGGQAQVLVSSLWSACGVAALWVGLRRDDHGWRRAGFVLLALATAKVALHDLAALGQGYRSLSTIALGLLLLAGAYTYQRLRDQHLG